MAKYRLGDLFMRPEGDFPVIRASYWKISTSCWRIKDWLWPPASFFVPIYQTVALHSAEKGGEKKCYHPGPRVKSGARNLSKGTSGSV